MKTYFEIPGLPEWRSRQHRREDAVALLRIVTGDAIKARFVVVEVQNTEVRRRTIKGDIITELVRDLAPGTLERVPRIISAKTLDSTYVVMDTVAAGAIPTPSWNRFGWNGFTHFTTRAEAEQEQTKRQAEAERLAAHTEADIKEAHVPTLSDILERDADKIAALKAEIRDSRQTFEKLKKQAETSVADEIANLKSQVAALEAKAAEEFGLRDAEEKVNAAIDAYKAAIHYDELQEQAQKQLYEYHNRECWPDSDCRQCTYEPGPSEIREYLVEHAEDFEVEATANLAAACEQGKEAAT